VIDIGCNQRTPDDPAKLKGAAGPSK